MSGWRQKKRRKRKQAKQHPAGEAQPQAQAKRQGRKTTKARSHAGLATLARHQPQPPRQQDHARTQVAQQGQVERLQSVRRRGARDDDERGPHHDGGERGRSALLGSAQTAQAEGCWCHAAIIRAGQTCISSGCRQASTLSSKTRRSNPCLAMSLPQAATSLRGP